MLPLPLVTAGNWGITLRDQLTWLAGTSTVNEDVWLLLEKGGCPASYVRENWRVMVDLDCQGTQVLFQNVTPLNSSPRKSLGNGPASYVMWSPASWWLERKHPKARCVDFFLPRKIESLLGCPGSRKWTDQWVSSPILINGGWIGVTSPTDTRKTWPKQWQKREGPLCVQVVGEILLGGSSQDGRIRG